MRPRSFMLIAGNPLLVLGYLHGETPNEADAAEGASFDPRLFTHCGSIGQGKQYLFDPSPASQQLPFTENNLGFLRQVTD
jgi:hypothetical protein